MATLAGNLDALRRPDRPMDVAMAVAGLEERLPPLLSVIAGMVDVTGFFTLGNIFTAHITGNLVVAAAAAVRGGPVNAAQLLAIPVFALALAAFWFIARMSRRPAPSLARLLLLIQFLLLAATLIFSILTRPSTNPHGWMAGSAAMIAVCAMACQYALFRLAIPGAISTAVMTGNFTNSVLSLMDLLSGHPLMTGDRDRLRRSGRLLAGFLVGCIMASAAVSLFADWSWCFPVALAGAAIWIAPGPRRGDCEH
jgi:uncharacterized membrane protein YoaK (UPF0700 family)